MDYSKTLNLPETDFPMRGNLPQREPKMLADWEARKIYEKRCEQGAGKEKFVLHDGPPYANGNIHMGHALNKVIKDIIMKYKVLRGYDVPYVPGWDTHGLPIEHAAIKILGLNRHELDPLTLRKKCQEYALKYVEIQKEDFKRLGVMGDWEHPYITLVPSYEARQIEVFGEMAKQGHIYKGLKSVYWCTSCETALAEAEIEYAERKSHAIFVKFPLVDAKGQLPAGVDAKAAYAVIWTTTPWTLPANVAIAVNKDFEYIWTKANGEFYFMAKALTPAAMQAAKIESYEVVGSVKGADAEGMLFAHPFLDRQSPVVLAEYVTDDAGTGCVHTAPGHGQDDFETGIRCNLPVLCPVDGSGKFTQEAGTYEGMFVHDANVPIIKDLAAAGRLFANGNIRHQYAHCWRCKNPIIYRATEQWFASVDGFRDEALKAIEDVRWIPSWGQARIHNMVADRHDWCISRQRAWGVPIPIFYCKACNEHILTDETIAAVRDLFAKEGSDAWWSHSAEEILPAGFACPKCGQTHFRKETDIMDVWFDSGSSHASVLRQRPELAWPADMYLEGSDQHRGWFQSSLLTAVATIGRAPYKSVLTCGFVVDGEGRKMSKSVGNVVAPKDIIDQYGADILRLWVASADYQSDIRLSKEILKQMAEVYRKIRNTFRYLLGNLHDFDPKNDKIAYEQLPELDRWALLRLEQVREAVTRGYEDYEFHAVYHTIHNFCAVDLSAVYLDILKDRLYTSKPDALERRAAQTAMYEILQALARMLSPVLTFTAEEVWDYMAKEDCMPESVQLADWPAAHPERLDAALEEKWNYLFAVRGEVTKALEIARKNKTIGHPLDANVTLYADEENYARLAPVADELATLYIVSGVRLEQGVPKVEDGLYVSEDKAIAVAVASAHGDKCERCWIYSPTVGEDSAHPTLCKRCAGVLG